MVIFLHVANAFYYQSYQGPFNAPSWWTFTVFKSLALPSVPLFVMLTGALLLQPSKVNEPIKVFLKKRVNRIGLAFIFWSAVYLAWGFYVTQTPINLTSVLQGIGIGLLTGPYYHFWYLYLIAGLYLITPILRAVIAFKSAKLLNYIIVLWFVGIGLIPLLPLITGFELQGEVFILGGYTGYFLLGFYLQKWRLRRPYMYGFLALGFALTLASTWVMTFPLEPLQQFYKFFDYLAVNVVIMSFALYGFLSRFPADWPGSKYPYTKKIIHTISCNSLPIYLFHVMILEALRMGFLGFTMDLTIIPIVEIPLAAAGILFVTLGLVLLMKKVPVLKKLIG